MPHLYAPVWMQCSIEILPGSIFYLQIEKWGSFVFDSLQGIVN